MRFLPAKKAKKNQKSVINLAPAYRVVKVLNLG